MQVWSTRGGAPPTTLSEALVRGLAPDGGLYVPQALPRLDASTFDPAAGRVATGVRLLAPFFEGDPLAPHLDAILGEAFAPPAPVVPTRVEGLDLLELFHGPTAAFKDFGAAFLAAALERLRPGRTTVLVATSGDTGGAVAAAFHRRPWARVVVLYPDGRVSPRQAHQLEAFGDNVVTLRVDGTFDDCQRLVKGAFADEALRTEAGLTSANSISMGRLLPQLVYHAQAALEVHAARGGAAGWIVPTGNLGNALAAWMVGAMGLPIGGVVLATNANDGLAQWAAGGPVPEGGRARATLANAMDVALPSNLERLTWFRERVEGPALHGVSVSDARIGEVVAEAPERWGHVVCPHTACALAAHDALEVCRTGHWVAVATAHPAKFESVVEPRIGRPVAVPEALGRLLERPRRGQALDPTAEALADVLRSSAGWA